MAKGEGAQASGLGSSASGLGSSAGGLAIRRWQEAMRWRRQMDRELDPLGLTFTRWLVLESTLVSIRQCGDAVSQSRVCECAELDKMTVSQAMRDLAQAGLVDRGPDAWGPGYRVIVTARGSRVAAAGRVRVEAVSQAEGAGEPFEGPPRVAR